MPGGSPGNAAGWRWFAVFLTRTCVYAVYRRTNAATTAGSNRRQVDRALGETIMALTGDDHG
jgi:hypothetical protein